METKFTYFRDARIRVSQINTGADYVDSQLFMGNKEDMDGEDEYHKEEEAIHQAENQAYNAILTLVQDWNDGAVSFTSEAKNQQQH